MKEKLYKITNTTVKPLKTNKNGQDIRPLRDRVGHWVQFPHPSKANELLIVYPNRHVIVDTVTDGILGLFRKGLVGITEMGDISDELKKLAFKPGEKKGEREAVLTPEPEMMQVPTPEPVEEKEEDLSVDTKGKASYMGSPVEEERLVNPDGEPNFIAKAPKGGLKKKKSSSILKDED